MVLKFLFWMVRLKELDFILFIKIMDINKLYYFLYFVLNYMDFASIMSYIIKNHNYNHQ